MMTLRVHGIGVGAAGLPDWQTTAAVLRGERAYQREPFRPARAQRLPRNEARRAGLSVRLAFHAAEQACAELDPAALATVFASSAADVDIADRLCRTIVDPAGEVSPTQFHNSVHNTAAGYWSIATGSREPASSLSGGSDSFVAGLCEAWALAAMERTPVLLVAFEAAGGGLLEARRPDIVDSCAIGLVLSPEPAGAIASLSAPGFTDEPATRLDEAGLERYRRCNPAAHGLPLLGALAHTRPSNLVLAADQGNLALSVTPGTP